MDKVKTSIPAIAFVIYLGKCLIFGASYTDASIILFLSALVGYFEFKYERKSIQDLQTTVDHLNKSNKELEKRMEELKTHVSSLKIGQQMRPRV